MTAMLKNVLVVADSDNRKTGHMPVTYRDMTTCPTDCPFLPTGDIGGCYGTGRLFGLARKYAGTSTVEEATWKVRLGMDRSARFLRDRVVGDVVGEDGKLDRDYITGIAEVATANQLTPFGYTHAWETFGLDDIAFLRGSGYVMNASTETPEAAERAALTRLPVTIVNDDIPEGTMIAGKRVVTCPAETRTDVTCASCGLCARPGRPAIIRFNTHGTAAAKARAAVAAQTQKEVKVAA